MYPLNDELCVLSGNAHPGLAKDICDYLKIPIGKSEAFKFPNDNTFVRILENVRERDVFVVQPICSPVNDNLMELLIMIDAAKRASAGRVTALIPYYGYSRTDKKDQPRVPITARLVADLLTAAGADRMLTVDLHAGQIQGFFNIPVDELTAVPLLVDYFREKRLDNLVVVAIDIGISKRARDVAERLDAPLAIVEKRRDGNKSIAESLNVIGDVAGKNVLTFDDEIDTAGSTIAAVNALIDRGAKQVFSCVTHPILSGLASERIENSTIQELVITDTVPSSGKRLNGKIKVLSVAPLLGEAIRRIHQGQSVGALFEER
jgi:ribose-phosphate pyrophosphokinase